MELRSHHWLIALSGALLVHAALLLIPLAPPRAAPVARLHLTVHVTPAPMLAGTAPVMGADPATPGPESPAAVEMPDTSPPLADEPRRARATAPSLTPAAPAVPAADTAAPAPEFWPAPAPPITNKIPPADTKEARHETAPLSAAARHARGTAASTPIALRRSTSAKTTGQKHSDRPRNKNGDRVKPQVAASRSESTGVTRAAPAARAAVAQPGVGLMSGAAHPATASTGAAASAAAGRADPETSAREVNNYYAALAAWLERHKRYPESARRRQEEGTVKLQFTIDRQGRVLTQNVVTGSGFPLLDREAQALLERAAPLPPLPAALAEPTLTLTLPIRFALR